MAKTLKKAVAMLLALCMVMSVTVFATEEESKPAFKKQVGDYLAYDAEGNSGGCTDTALKTTEDGKVTLSKTIEQTGKDAFDITLQVTTTENLEVIKKARDAAIVIVMDVSGSMQFDMSGGGYCTNCGKYKSNAYDLCSKDGRWCDTSGWGNTWAQHEKLESLGVTPEHGDTRFALMENAVSAFLDDFADNSGSNAKRMVSMVCYNDKVEKELSWVNVTEADGMEAAKAVVASGALAALTGGDTNTSLGLQRANEYLDDMKDIENTYVLLLTDGAPYTAIQYKADGTYAKASGVGYDCDLTLVAADRLKAEHADTEVYTICLGFDPRGKLWTATHSIVDGVLTGTDKKFNIVDLMKALASDEEHYFHGEDIEDFEISLGSIVEETIASGAKLWTVTDPMGNYIDFGDVYGDHPAVFKDGILSWDLLNEKPVSVENGIYTYTMKYSITLDTEAEGFEFDTLYPANKATSLKYALVEDGEITGIKTDYFNVPTVFAEEPMYGTLQLQKIDKYTKEVLGGVEFTLYQGKEIGTYIGTYVTDENGALSIENLLPGSYQLKETKAPYGYTIPSEPISFEVTEEGIVVIEESDYAKVTDAKEAQEIVVTWSEELTEEEIAALGVAAPEIDVTVALVPGEENTKTESKEFTVQITDGEKPAEGDTIYDYTEAVISAYREVTAKVSEVDTQVKLNKSDKVTGNQPALKFDRNSTADQKAQKVARELYTDDGHFHDPATFTVTNAPEGYPWEYVGHGDYSGHYISHVKVIYDRDEAGNALKDADGNYIIKELQHASSGTPLHYGTELVTNPEGPFHYATGTRPQQFLLMNEEGDTMYGYCIDLETGANSGKFYRLANLEDNNYYASEEAENHVRNIVLNGYWGTESGDGSLASLKEALKAAAAANLVDVEQDVTLVNRKKFTTGYECQEGEYHYGNYVYWSLPTEHVVLTNEVIDQMTEGEALDAMQAAIWSWANGSNATLNGVDRAIVGDLYAASSQMSDSLNGKNDPEGAARTKALYQYLMSLNAPKESSVIINDKTFAKDMSLKVGAQNEDGTYAAELKFSIDGERNANDDLKVVLTYTDAYGEIQTIEVALTGEGAATAENGYYTISDLKLVAGVPFDYTLQIVGEQYLEKGAYIFTAEGGINASQTFVTVAEGTNSVDVTKSMSIVFNVNEYVKGEYNRHWSDAKILVVENEPPYVEWDPGKASNISFMLLDKETGEVEFLKKYDIGDETSRKIPVKEGKVSVVFIKQSTSGMFWFSEEVSEELQDAAIECLKDNNPSYKGHNAIAFGEGEHDLEFKKGKFATYNFHFGTFVIEDEEIPTTPEVDEEDVKEETSDDDILVNGNPDNSGNTETEEPNEGDDEPVIDPEEDDEIEEPEVEAIPGMGVKQDTLLDRESNRYEVTIEVPGIDGDTRHDEVILMVDGSYSMDNEWPAMKDAINKIGETVLNGSGTTQLTLMAFGMGDNEVLVHVKDAADLAAALGELPGNLLYGRSSTNCEAGFDGVARYIARHDDTLKDVNVIFISDGNLNTDETLRAFDTNWRTWATKYGALTVAQTAFDNAVGYGTNLPAAFETVFGDRFDGNTKDEILIRAFDNGEVTDEEFFAFAEQLWTDVYEYSGLTPGAAYPVSAAERAFVKYDKENGTYIQNLFYYTTYKSTYVTYGDRWNRTPAAADALAAMDEVKAMYVVDYDSYTAWMDTGITSDKSTFVQSNGIAGLCEALEGALTDLAKTPFNDVVVTDYMSKWVNLDAATLKIVDNATGDTIWTAAEGWLIDENRPTAQEVPVVVELVDPADYEFGGDNVIGNTSGDIYKLTWYVKDGAMLRSDTYKLVYEVTVDTAEEGFRYEVSYPANGYTDLFYKDENGEDQTNDIKVPDVDAPAVEPETFKITFKKGEASNISFLLIDKATGKVEFLKKIDIDDETSFEIPAEEGKISAVFVKQSTSGMLWFSEEVDAEIEAETLKCVKKNNKSYKDCAEVAYGAGDVTWAFKKNKYVTYTFSAK